MTFEELKNNPKEILTPDDIAPILRCDANVIRFQAKQDIRALGFPCSKIGSRLKIPKAGFIIWFEHGGR